MYRFTTVALLAMSAGHALHAEEPKAEARVVVVAPEAGAKGEQKIEQRTFRIGAAPTAKSEARVVIVGPEGTKAEWTTEGAASARGTMKDGKRSIKVIIEENGETHVFDGDDIASLEFLPESVRKWMTADGDGPRMLRFFREGGGDNDAPAAFRFRAGEGDGADGGINWQEHMEGMHKQLKGMQKQLEGMRFDFDFDLDTDSIMESARSALAEALSDSGLSQEQRQKIMQAIESMRRGGGQPRQMQGRGPAGAGGEMPEALRQRIAAIRGRFQQQQERAEVEKHRAEQTVRERENVIRERFQLRERERAHAAPQPPAPPASDAEARLKRLEERMERIERMLERLVTRG